MAVQSNMRNMLLCLTISCVICSAILGLVYALTLSPIKDMQAKMLKESISYVLPSDTDISESKLCEVGGLESEYYMAQKEGKTVAYAIRSQVMGFGGPLVLMVGVMADGTIYKTSVLSQNETPGLGAKCSTDEKFITQWQGLSSKHAKLAVRKDGGEIDAITASTITSRAYTLAVQNALDALVKLQSSK